MKKLRLLSFICLIFAVGCASTSNEVIPPPVVEYTETWGIIDGIKVDSICVYYDYVTNRKRFAAKIGNDTIWAQRYWRKYERKDIGTKTIITYEDKEGKHIL